MILSRHDKEPDMNGQNVLKTTVSLDNFRTIDKIDLSKINGGINLGNVFKAAGMAYGAGYALGSFCRTSV